MRVQPTTLTGYNPFALNALSRNSTDGIDDAALTLFANGDGAIEYRILPNAANTIADIHIFQWSADAEL